MKEIRCSRCGMKIKPGESVSLIAEAYEEKTEDSGMMETLSYNLRRFATVTFLTILQAKTPELCQTCTKKVFQFAKGDIIPPIQPGDTLYRYDPAAGEVEPLRVISVLLAEAGNEIEVECRGRVEFYYQDEIGESVFMTEKEAEGDGKGEDTGRTD